MKDAEPNDLILISDVDEIPKLEGIKQKIKKRLYVLIKTFIAISLIYHIQIQDGLAPKVH